MRKRPASATFIGWLFILGGLVMAPLSWIAVCAERPLPGDGATAPSVPPDVAAAPIEEPWPFAAVSFLFEHLEVLAFLQSGLGVASIAGGIALLMLRPWGRQLTEALTWLGLAYAVGYGVFLIGSLGWASTLESQSGEPPPGFFFVFMAVAALLAIATHAVPMVLVLIALRGKTIREAVRRSPIVEGAA